MFYYIPIIDTSLELSFFWLSDTESQTNELRFSDTVSLFYRLLPGFAATLHKVFFKHGTRDGKHDITSRNVT